MLVCSVLHAGLQLSGDDVSANEAEEALRAMRESKPGKGWLGAWRGPKDSREAEARAQAKAEARAAAKASKEARKAERLSSKARSSALQQSLSPPGECSAPCVSGLAEHGRLLEPVRQACDVRLGRVIQEAWKEHRQQASRTETAPSCNNNA